MSPWDSSQVLARLMVDFNIEGKRILELGCGMALSSLLLNRRGGDITATDYHPQAGVFLLAGLVLAMLLPAAAAAQDAPANRTQAFAQLRRAMAASVAYNLASPLGLSLAAAMVGGADDPGIAGLGEELHAEHPYDDPRVIAGQGTVALEMLKVE